MPFPTNAASTELDAVNQILSSVGQAPVTTLDLQNPEVFITLSTLREVSKQVQLEGWTFNTEREYPMVRNETTNEISLPANLLAIDANLHTHKNDYDLVMRNGKLYDRLNKLTFLLKTRKLMYFGTLTFNIYHLLCSLMLLHVLLVCVQLKWLEIPNCISC